MSENNQTPKVTKAGKKPLSTRTEATLTEESLFGSPLAVPAHIKAELEAKGLAHRWVDAQQLYQNSGYHPKGWTPYKVEQKQSDTMSASELKFGRDPEGVVRRGSMILAVRSKTMSAQHRQLLDDKASRLAGKYQKESADSLRQAAKAIGSSVQIHEGYDENE